MKCLPSRLQVLDADEEQSEAGQESCSRTRLALAISQRKAPRPSIGMAKAAIRRRNPKITTSYGVEVVPNVAPMIARK